MNIWPFRRKQPQVVFVVVARAVIKGKPDELCTLSAHKTRPEAEREADLREKYQSGLYKDVTVCLTIVYKKHTGPLTPLSRELLKFRECK